MTRAKELCCVLALLLLQLGVVSRAAAEIYKYVDEAGKSHYVTNPEEIPKQYREQAAEPANLPKVSKVPGINIPTSARSSGSRQSKSIEIYVADWCPHCRNLEKFLKKRRIRYSRYDIEKSTRAKKKYKKLGGGGLPLVKIGSKILHGNRQQAILKELGL